MDADLKEEFVSLMPLKTLLLILALAFVRLGFAESLPTTSDPNLDSLIKLAWEKHPDLSSMRLMIEAESARGVMAKGWMNPTLSVGLMDLPQSFDIHQDGGTSFNIGAMQRFSYPGKRRISTEISGARVTAAELDYASARQQMAAMVAMAYYGLAASIELDSLLRVGLSLTEEMATASGWMNASGMGRQSDVERANFEKENWRLKIIANRGEIERQRADLAYAIGGAIDTSRRPTLPLDLPSLPKIDSVFALGALERAPVVLAAMARAKGSASSVKRAEREWYPDIDVSLTYGIKPYLRVTGYDATGMLMTEKMDMDNMISLELSAPVPLFGKGNQKAQIAEASAMNSQARADASRVKLELEKRLRKLHASWKEQNDCCAFVKDNLIGQADALYQAVQIDYRAGKAPYMELSRARMNLIMAYMELITSRAEAWGYKAEWDAELGLIGETIEENGGTR